MEKLPNEDSFTVSPSASALVISFSTDPKAADSFRDSHLLVNRLTKGGASDGFPGHVASL